MGNELFRKLTKATGLPKDLISNELAAVLSEKGFNKDDLTMEGLRDALAQYLREVILHAKDKFEQGVVIEEEIHPDDLGRD